MPSTMMKYRSSSSIIIKTKTNRSSPAIAYEVIANANAGD